MGRYTLYKTDESKYVDIGTWYKKQQVIAVKYEFLEIKSYISSFNYVNNTVFQLDYDEIESICEEHGFTLVHIPYYIGSITYYKPIEPYSVYVREDKIHDISSLCKHLTSAEKEKEERVKKKIEEIEYRKEEEERIKQDRINSIPFKDVYCGDSL
jgi:hypothetical protein